MLGSIRSGARRSSLAMIIAAFALVGLAGLPVSDVNAGGMQLATRGVRPTARGGAFVAGADDLGALWFNPAGLARMGTSTSGKDARTKKGADTSEKLDKKQRFFLFDAAYVAQSAEYTRIDSGNVAQPTVKNQAGGLPIPTVAVGVRLSDKLTVAGGLYAPFAGLGKYDEKGTQRYSLVDLSKSLLVTIEGAVSYRVSDRLRIGAGLQNMIFSMDSSLVFGACIGQTVCAPEDPDFDAVGRVSQLALFNPSGVVGAQFDVHERATVGLAFQLPFHVAGEGSFQTRLPADPFFDNATIAGDRVDVGFWLPPILRFGVEVVPVDRWRVELAAGIEFWSIQDEFEIEPKNVRIENAPGLGTYELGSLSIPRSYEDTVSLHLGVEGQPVADVPLTVLAGWSYETAAAPDAYLSVLTVDGDKNLFAGGLGYKKGRWQLNATLAVVSVADRTVDPAVGMSPQLNPVRDNPDDPDPPRTFVNWGTYSSSWFIAGFAVDTSF